MKKQIANILTSVRIFLALILLTFSGLNTGFVVLFSICGITDLIDGPVARVTGSQSSFGAKLDTVGDVLTYFAMVKILILEKVITYRTLLWFAVPLLGMFVSGFIGRVKFHTFVFTHTALSKVFGVGCFLVPFSVFSGAVSILLTALWFVACLAATEMIAIQIIANHADPDILFLPCVYKTNKIFSEASARNDGLTNNSL